MAETGILSKRIFIRDNSTKKTAETIVSLYGRRFEIFEGMTDTIHEAVAKEVSYRNQLAFNARNSDGGFTVLSMSLINIENSRAGASMLKFGFAPQAMMLWRPCFERFVMIKAIQVSENPGERAAALSAQIELTHLKDLIKNIEPRTDEYNFLIGQKKRIIESWGEKIDKKYGWLKVTGWPDNKCGSLVMMAKAAGLKFQPAFESVLSMISENLHAGGISNLHIIGRESVRTDGERSIETNGSDEGVDIVLNYFVTCMYDMGRSVADVFIHSKDIEERKAYADSIYKLFKEIKGITGND